MHYGPPPEPRSGLTTPASELNRRLSDIPTGWDTKPQWDDATPWAAGGLEPLRLGDGPPWSEDEDLQSPVVSSRPRKHKNAAAALAQPRGRNRREGNNEGQQDSGGVMDPENFDRERGYYVGTSGDGRERYYVNQGGEANGPGGEYVTYPPDEARHSSNPYQLTGQRPRQYADQGVGLQSDSDDDSAASSPSHQDDARLRYSRDYVFTITSPDEEMHGKAVALYDFARENENELPLAEGQIIWVSYRYGDGWLVAQDPKTQESGLVPEEYVRLLREIEGGMTSLTGSASNTGHMGNTGNVGNTTTESPASPTAEGGTPTQAEHPSAVGGHTPTPSNVSSANGYHQPIVSTFSTSSKDLDPYPHHLLGTLPGQAPPQVVHYHGQRGGSQANTPTLLHHQDVGIMRRGSDATPAVKKMESVSTLDTLPDVATESPTGPEDEGASPSKLKGQPGSS
jgi:hypothetical protein